MEGLSKLFKSLFDVTLESVEPDFGELWSHDVHKLVSYQGMQCNWFKWSIVCWEARWPSGRASDSGARGWGFDPHSDRRVVSLSKIHLPPKKYW